MAEIWTMGEMLVEIMRTETDEPLDQTALFSGPYPSGSSAIMISTATRLGHSCGIISGVGRDGFGKCLLDRLQKDGVDTSKVLIDEDKSTACAFVSYDHNGDRKYLFHWDETPATEAVMPDVTEPSLKEARFFHIMGCALTAKLSYGWEIVKTAEAMRAQGTKISFDPNVRTEHLTNPTKSKECFDIIHSVLSITSIFEPGMDELLLITGEKDVDAAVKKCFENENLEILMLKMGSKGTRVFTRDGKVTDQGLFTVTSKDPTGAGDTSDAAFLCSLLEGRSIEESSKRAAAAGAINVMAFGPMEGRISPENIDRMIAGTFTA